MHGESSDQLVTLLARAIQAYCSSHVEFASCVEVVGHIHVNIDRSLKVDYVVSEEVVKALTDSGVPSFFSRSYLSHPPAQVVSGCRGAQRRSSRHSHSPSSGAEDSVVTVQQAHSVDPACVNAPSSQSQALPGDHGGNSLASVGVRGAGENVLASNQMRVTVSFDPAGVLPLIKQESSLSAEGASPDGHQPGMEEHHRSVSHLVTCPEAPDLLLPSYRQENGHPAAPHCPTTIQPPVSSTDSFPPQVSDNSQTLQSSMAATNMVTHPPMIQIQEVRSEASGTVVTCSPHSVPPAVLSTRQLQESYSSTRPQPQEDPLQPSPLTNHSSLTSIAYLDGSGPHQVDPNRGSVSSGQRDSPSVGEPRCPAVSLNCQSEAGASLTFGSLCLDGVTVKEEVMEEEPPSPQDPYTLESAGQDQELSAFSNMLMKSLAAPGDGSQLILMREGLQQSNLNLPFPVMLHTHASLSPSLNSPHLEDSSAQGSATDMEAPSSSAITSPAMSLTLAGEEEAGEDNWFNSRQRGFQPGNQCWKLQQRWRAASKARASRFHRKPTAGLTGSAKSTVLKMLSSTRKIELFTDRSRLASTAARMASLASAKTQNKHFSRKSGTAKTAVDRKSKTKVGHPKAKKDASASVQKGPTHTLKKVPWTVQKKQPRKTCIVCKEKGSFPMSCYFCPCCPKQPGYCRVRNCFSSYHSLMGLKFTLPSASTSRRTSKS